MTPFIPRANAGIETAAVAAAAMAVLRVSIVTRPPNQRIDQRSRCLL
jgi:hypothetical protein